MNAKLRSPLWWFGGKSRLSSKIIPIVQSIPHRIYVEPFGGGASVLIRKVSSPVEVYNDLNYDVYEFFRVLSDEAMFAQFYRRVE